MADFNPDCKQNTCDCFLKFSQWTDNGKDWYWVVDNLGRFVWSSAQCERIIGYTRDELVGKKVFDLLPERDRARVIGFLQTTSSNYSEYNDFEMIYLHKDGREVYVSASGSPVFNEDGSYFGYRGITRDVTEEKQRQWELLESRKLWERAQKTIKIASWEQNYLTDEIYYSREMYNMFELPKAFVDGKSYKPFLDRVHPEDAESVKQANQAIKRKTMQMMIEFRLLFPDGRIKYCRESLESITNDFGDVIITTGLIQDITELHDYHCELNRKIKFEHYVAKIAERFVLVREHEETIDTVLSEIGELIGANRTYIFEFDFENKRMSNTYEWCDTKTQPCKQSLQNIPLEIAGYWLHRFYLKKYVRIQSVERIRDERKGERETLMAQSIKSLLAWPIYCEDKLWGFFGLDNTETEYSWDQETMTLTQVFTQIMQNFLEKKKADEKLRNMNRILEQAVADKTRDLRKALVGMQETQAHFNLALEASDLGLWKWDFENDIVPEGFAFSKYFRHVDRSGSKELYSTPIMRWEQSVHPDYEKYVFHEKAKYIEGLTKNYSIDYKIWIDSYNDWRWINSTGFIISRDEEGNPKVMVGTYKDITETKENELILENARKSAERQVKNKAEFLSNLNHELRTPLTIILGNTELLMHSHLDRELKSFVKTTNRAANQLLEIIEDIVDLSRIDEGSVLAELQTLDSRKFFRKICDTYHELTENAGLTFVYEIDPTFPETLITDPKLLKKICNNIVENAVKFTKEGQVKFLATVRDDEIILSVSDTGIGIPEDKLPIIFERFTQADSSSRRRYGGTGLGLAIAKSAIDILNGRILVESKLGEGTLFKIYLPKSYTMNS
ncbi:MAG TPA: PAS domain-containing protein [Thermotogota bacterium]|nr:PAS domain-containing protein [Thermotogota bacterium]